MTGVTNDTVQTMAALGNLAAEHGTAAEASAQEARMIQVAQQIAAATATEARLGQTAVRLETACASVNETMLKADATLRETVHATRELQELLRAQKRQAVANDTTPKPVEAKTEAKAEGEPTPFFTPKRKRMGYIGAGVGAVLATGAAVLLVRRGRRAKNAPVPDVLATPVGAPIPMGKVVAIAPK